MIKTIESWHQDNQRDLPWRRNRKPYYVWLSEIMLQQTQVVTVIGYFNKFTKNFPELKNLAEAPEDKVLSLWSGLGYYSRCRNLHKAAKYIFYNLNNKFPNTYESLLELPGVGSYTAGAIMAFAYNKPAPVVDGNISRVLSRYYADDTVINNSLGKKHYEQISLELVKKSKIPRDFQEGLMELGALICTAKNPKCEFCPIENSCLAKKRNKILELPTKERKIKKQNIYKAYALLIFKNKNQNKIYLEKNKKNLYQGLYEPISLEAPAEFILDSAEKLELEIRHKFKNFNALKIKSLDPKNPIKIKRVLTHRNLFMHGFKFEVKNLNSKLEQELNKNFYNLEQLDQIGMSQAVRKLLEATLP